MAKKRNRQPYKKKTNDRLINVRVDTSLWFKARAKAFEEQRSVSDVIRQLLLEYVEE